MPDWRKHKLESGLQWENLRYADDTTLMAESEELTSLLMKEESEKVNLKFNIQKTKIMAQWQAVTTNKKGEATFCLFLHL